MLVSQVTYILIVSHHALLLLFFFLFSFFGLIFLLVPFFADFLWLLNFS